MTAIPLTDPVAGRLLLGLSFRLVGCLSLCRRLFCGFAGLSCLGLARFLPCLARGGGLRRRFGSRLGGRPLRLGGRPRPGLLRRLFAVSQNLGDPDEGELLAVATPAPRILAPPLLERDDLPVARLRQHLRRDRCAGNRRVTKRQAVAADDQDLAELDDLAGFALDLVDLQHVIGDNAILLAPRSDDREHRFHPRVRYPALGMSRTGFLAVGLWVLSAAWRPRQRARTKIVRAARCLCSLEPELSRN